MFFFIKSKHIYSRIISTTTFLAVSRRKNKRDALDAARRFACLLEFSLWEFAFFITHRLGLGLK